MPGASTASMSEASMSEASKSEASKSESSMSAASMPEAAIPEPAKKPVGRPFPTKPLPPDALLAEVRGKVEAGEMTCRAAAATLERSESWFRRHAAKNGWAVPARRAKANSTKPVSTQPDPAPPQAPTPARKPARKNPARKRGKADGARALARASQAAWRALDMLTSDLEGMMAAGGEVDAIAKQTTAINKLVAETRRNGLHDGEPHLTGDANGHAGDAADDAADTAEHLARARADLAARLLAGFATPVHRSDVAGHEPSEPAPRATSLGDESAA